MQKIIISAPFGNWFTSEHATSTIGTYTHRNRSGVFRSKMLWKMLSTIRYERDTKGWVNKLGLPNPGVQHLQKKIDDGYSVKDKILSIHGFNTWEWVRLLKFAKSIQPHAVELNVSCPNVNQKTISPEVFEIAVDTGLDVIVKLPPIKYDDIFNCALSAGVKIYHCCNTYPTSKGGLSGIPLKPLSEACILSLLQSEAKLDIIAGGGIRTLQDIKDYKKIKANRFAIGTMLFNPKYWFNRCFEEQIQALDKEANFNE